ncbi:ABC transporter substrate-binding protein [Anaerofilum sp. BX8]|uniref:ABC transporter substrate-binding protein n=1 Tax=Anaerofilum hominis TaxID=2763016 RepID=A0A923I8F2_9FIRM|nr:ABC transporter substrate-binding protein [Anaerofilum hominis]MBC5580721.1 ABC transporter substrate-binding protein [Anaerofilum hominis]
MKHSSRWLKIAGLALTASIAMSLLTGCGGSDAGDSGAAGGAAGSAAKNLTFVMSGDVGDLSPFGGDSGGRHHTYRMMYDCLCASKGLGQSVADLQGQMAKTVTVVDDTTVDVELYDYIHDNQGNAIKASDVVFSYEAAIASGTMEKLNGYLDSIEATGDTTVRIKLTAPSKGAMEWCLCTVPVISQSWFEAASDADKTSKPATTGAYELVETVASSHTTLKKNADYWQTDESLRTFYGAQPFETITLNVVTESAMRVIALQNLEADISQNVPANEISSFLNEDGTSVEGWNVFADENGRFNVFMFNNDNSVFADNKALRQAVLYGIDFEAVRQGYGNTPTNGSVCHDFSPDVASDFNPEWKNEDYYDYNIDKAKELMAEAGYPDGGFTIRLMYQNSTTATAGMTVVQDYLSKLGITVELNPADQALFNSYKYDDTKWDIIVDSKATSDYVTSVWQNVFDTNAFENGSACFTHDDKLQELLETASNTTTSSPEALDAFHDYLKDQAYAIGMFWNYTYYVAQDGVTEMYPDGFGNLTANTVGLADGFASVAE